MLQRQSAWVADNRWLSAGIALVLVAVIAGVAILTGGTSHVTSTVAGSNDNRVGASEPSMSTGPGASGAPNAPGSKATVGSGVPVIPGLPSSGSTRAKACIAAKVNQPGVTPMSITISQIVTDSDQLPQQLRPAHEGLQAFVKLVNSAGGICHRTLTLQYSNDNLNPATHRSDFQRFANNSFAFVGNESLLDFLDYNQQPPFDPTVQGAGSSVPDVGGLAFAYNRSQSAWHAGVIGSVSPTLVGGGQFKFYTNEQRAKGTPCRRGAVVYLNEPTGASQDEANLGAVALEQSWGGGLGSGNTKQYSANLLDPEPAYEALVDRMVSDGMNCAFTYTDLNSNVNLVKALNTRGVWPPAQCKLGPACFRVVYIPLSAYDSQFVTNGGVGAHDVSTFIPNVPFTETSNPALQAYVRALRSVPGAHPSTFSLLGFASGLMLVQGLESCAAAPTRTCLMGSLRKMQNFTAGGLLGGTSPFKTTRATYDRYGTFNWKWIFYNTVAMRVQQRNGTWDFYRVNPKEGFFADTLHVARGSPA